MKSKSIFLLDSIGALISFIFLFGILRNFQEYFGMPMDVLDVLSTLAGVYTIFSFACYLFIRNNWKPFLTIVVVANLFYTILSLSYLMIHYPELTLLGIVYFVGEKFILLGIVGLEVKFLITSPGKDQA
ncbi:MAG: hypothetical protein JJT78_00825 [Leptospira sp.]|nr:hypothetical protein [Leptospira sp.]